MNLCTSVFVYVGSIGLYKRIVNADTQSIRIANADEQGTFCYYFQSIYNIFLLLKRRWLQKMKFFEDGGVLFSSYVFLLYDRF